jgi:hypothetical protein
LPAWDLFTPPYEARNHPRSGMVRKEIMKFGTMKFAWRELYTQGLVLAIAATVVAVWVFTKPIVFTYDSFTYIDQARELQLGHSVDSKFFSRLPLFPAILLALHVTDLKQSVFWLIVFQSCLAVASCWLFYLTARLVEPRGAFVISLAFVASLLPFLNVKYIMTEQTFFFETVLTLYGIVAYLVARTNRAAWLAIAIIGVGTALMTLTRPQGAFVIPVVFGILALLVCRRAWTPLLAAVVAFGAVWSVQVVDQKIRAESQTASGSLDSSNMTGAMLLFTFYLDGPRANIRIAPENGPATAELKTLLLDELAKPDALARRAGYLKSVSPQDVPAYVDKSFAEPNADFYIMLAYTALKERLSAEEVDRLLVRVCLEAALAYPIQTAGLITQRMFETYFNPWQLVTPVHPQFQAGTFQSSLADEIAAAGDYFDATSTDRAIDRNLRWLMQGTIVVIILTLPIALLSRTWRITVALLVFGLYLNFAVAVGNLPLFRYAIYTIVANVLCGYVGAVAVASALRDRYLRKTAV